MTLRPLPGQPLARTEPITIHVPEALFARVQAAREKHGISQTELMNRLIEMSLPMFENEMQP
jgi:ribosome-binding protein aMBF1 (putative translation factor)